MNLKHYIGILLFLLLAKTFAFVNPLINNDSINSDPSFLEEPSNWADSVFCYINSRRKNCSTIYGSCLFEQRHYPYL